MKMRLYEEGGNDAGAFGDVLQPVLLAVFYANTPREGVSTQYPVPSTQYPVYQYPTCRERDQ